MRTPLVASALFAATAALGAAAPAHAGGEAGSVGLGVEYTTLGLGGVSLNYDGGAFHAGGFLGFWQNAGGAGDNWELDLGGRFYYHAHSTAMADFGVGGQLGIQILENGAGPGDDATIITLDLGAQIRAFVASNVALSVTFGIAVATADGEGFTLSGAPVGAAGIHYYF